ncbi:uncharacterized protein LY89DRAFT_677817 [Mollisia scopiformis]|uniref:Uncharacterized protein n=1 Tax=Mollisia scopiformis TaxID=149040 RepID=A0A132B5B6_MOLSC|nr:uncharacterized protein LY89DRAFT_677817 [Mollisia scopiformis]KUJ07605.1 hypothetical protein LY89DRAFT_677817 [Mollisia scopiformis]
MSTMENNLGAEADTSSRKAKLNYDLWCMIFDEVLEKAKGNPLLFPGQWFEPDLIKWLRDLRLVSKDFSQILTPFAYETVELRRCQIPRRDLFGIVVSCSDFQKNLSQFTKIMVLEVSINQNYLSSLVKLMAECESLRGVIFKTEDLPGSPVAEFMSKILEGFLRKSMLYRIWYDQGYCKIRSDNVSNHILPLPKNKGAFPKKIRNKKRESILPKEEGEPRALQLLRHPDNRAFSNSEQFSYRFPAVTHLSLIRYPWIHSASTYNNVWNFSKLEQLDLAEMNLLRFFEIVCAKDFENLHSLCLRVYLDERSRDIGMSVGSARAALRAIKKLKMLWIDHERWASIFPPILICEIGSSLQWLALHDRTGPVNRRSMSVKDLWNIRVHCPSIYCLQIDWPWNSNKSEQHKFLEEVCRFVELRVLVFATAADPFEFAAVEAEAKTTYESQALGQYYEYVRPSKKPSLSPEYRATSRQIVGFLHEHKYGKPLEFVSIDQKLEYHANTTSL